MPRRKRRKLTRSEAKRQITMSRQIPRFYRSHKWEKLRGEVRKRDKWTCQYCGGVGRQADHIMPRGKGGPDTLENLVCCCAACNFIVGGLVFPTFNDKKAWILARRGLQ